MGTSLSSKSRRQRQDEGRHEGKILVVGFGPVETGAGLGLNVHLAGTGKEAVELLRESRFDVMLISGELRDMAVWELAAMVRRFWPWQRWMLVSGELSDEEQRRAYKLGAAAIFNSFPEMGELAR